jgi:hypothetical protein
MPNVPRQPPHPMTLRQVPDLRLGQHPVLAMTPRISMGKKDEVRAQVSVWACCVEDDAADEPGPDRGGS